VLLEARGLEVHYGGIRAVKGIDLEVGEGELVCLVGANGAGKTSTLKAICGLVPASGSLRYGGRELSGIPVHELPRRGLVLVPEGRGIFPQLTVEENLAMGAYARGEGEPESQYQRFPRLRERRHQTAGTLSGGEQQMLAIGRALMSAPRLLLIDEASLGLSPALAVVVFEVVKRICRDGTTVVIVEQNVGVLPYADRALIMEQGTIVYAGVGDEIQSADLRETYLGS